MRRSVSWRSRETWLSTAPAWGFRSPADSQRSASSSSMHAATDIIFTLPLFHSQLLNPRSNIFSKRDAIVPK
eukprot:4447540-Prymnesium_polylepis.1